jgi:hypothetical protein
MAQYTHYTIEHKNAPGKTSVVTVAEYQKRLQRSAGTRIVQKHTSDPSPKAKPVAGESLPNIAKPEIKTESAKAEK